MSRAEEFFVQEKGAEVKAVETSMRIKKDERFFRRLQEKSLNI